MKSKCYVNVGFMTGVLCMLVKTPVITEVKSKSFCGCAEWNGNVSNKKR